MGTPGVPFDVPKDKIVTALKNAKGVIEKTAIELKYAPNTVLRHIKKDPELVELLANLRSDYEETLLNLAEGVVETALRNHATDANNAVKMAMFTLNARGRERGWDNTLQDLNKNQKIEFTVNYSNDSEHPIKILSEAIPTQNTESA